MKIVFRWYDFYCGFYYNRKKKWLYIFPIPMIGLIIKLNIKIVFRRGDFVKYVGPDYSHWNKEMRIRHVMGVEELAIMETGEEFDLKDLKKLR